jgi:hypothetical protein
MHGKTIKKMYIFSNLWTAKDPSFNFATAEIWQLPVPVEGNITTFVHDFHRVLHKSQICVVEAESSSWDSEWEPP